MKKKPPFTYQAPETESSKVQEVSDLSYATAAGNSEPQPMVRTQIYLSARQQKFLQRQAQREGETMAAMIRRFIDLQMAVPEDAWKNNSLLDPAPEDPADDLPADASINLDHYVYGSPKAFKKVRGKWVPTAPPK